MKIICVCGLGQGSSLILRMSVESALKKLGVEADVDHMDVSSAAAMDADYIITSSELAQTLERAKSKVVVVNNYFDQNEIKEALEDVLF